MSEAIPGVPRPDPAPTRDASVALVFRQFGAAREVFWLKRERQMRFAGGFYAFPGGKVDPEDSQVSVEGAQGLEATLRVCAARELFEEAGLLVAAGVEALDAAALAELRKAVLDGTLGFGDALARHGLRLRARDFLDAGRWVTPAFLPVRFDARFFLVQAPEGQSAEVALSEASEGGWVQPAQALQRWQEGTALLHPPNLYGLQVLAEVDAVADASARLTLPPHCPNFVPTRIEFQQGVRLFPMETPTLPPATHTNTYVLGNGELLVVDPGASDVRQYAKLLALLAGLQAEGCVPKAVLLTHHHLDHIGGAKAVSERLGVPVWCHAQTADRLPFSAGRLLEDGEVLELAGHPRMRFQVLHTPGHARGHLCLYDLASRAAVVGDMVAGLGTILIDPPEGDMREYLKQLARLAALPVSTLYPAHGPAIPDGVGKLEEYQRHRAEREEKVLLATPEEGASLEEICEQAYADVGGAQNPLALRSTHAIVLKLKDDGKIVGAQERFARK